MVWRIESWDLKTGKGKIRSPHIGPLKFGSNENIDRVADFEIGEEVEAGIVQVGNTYQVTEIIPRRQRQPSGTLIPEFEKVNKNSAFNVLRSGSDELVIWVGFCCCLCSPDSVTLRFSGVTEKPKLKVNNDYDFTCLRLATDSEIEENDLVVAEDETAYCFVNRSIVPNREAKRYVVAKQYHITPGFDT